MRDQQAESSTGPPPAPGSTVHAEGRLSTEFGRASTPRVRAPLGDEEADRAALRRPGGRHRDAEGCGSRHG